MIVAFRYPPTNAVGAQRPRFLAERLPELGWYPVVLTPRHPGRIADEARYTVLETEYRDVLAPLRRLGRRNRQSGTPDHVPLDTSDSGPPSWLGRWVREALCHPDDVQGWIAPAVEAGRSLLVRKNVDALFSTSPPGSAHVVASRLQREFGIPWIADLRDLWGEGDGYRFGAIRGTLDRRSARNTLSTARCLTTVTESLAEVLRIRHPGKPVAAIPTGFDPDEWSLVRDLSVSEPPRLTFLHSGSLYGGARDPGLFLETLRELIDTGILRREEVRVEFLGAQGKWIDHRADTLGLNQVVKTFPLVPRPEALARQASATVLLLVLSHASARSLTGKIFEYLGARRTILAFGGPRGEVARLIEETRAGHWVGTREEMRAVVCDLVAQWRRMPDFRPATRDDVLQRYTVHSLARRIASLLERSVESAGGLRSSDGLQTEASSH